MPVSNETFGSNLNWVWALDVSKILLARHREGDCNAHQGGRNSLPGPIRRYPCLREGSAASSRRSGVSRADGKAGRELALVRLAIHCGSINFSPCMRRSAKEMREQRQRTRNRKEEDNG